MYTANIVDTVIFRNIGKSSNPRWQSLKQVVKRAETELWIPAAIYRELADYGVDPPVNPYLDKGVEKGWIRVATPLPGNRGNTFDDVDEPVEKAHHLTDELLNRESKYPVLTSSSA